MRKENSSAPSAGTNRLPLVLITSLFFLWGLSYGLLDVLNKHFQEVLRIGKRESSLLQAAYFGAYFIMALPAGRLMQRFGYKWGVLAGLLLFASGACLFYPAARLFSYPAFLFALFVLASGLAFLETAANPFITVLGDPDRGAFRLNLAQSFNGVGSIAGPLLGGMLFFGASTAASGFDRVQLVYFGIAIVVALLAVVVYKTPMPEPHTATHGQEENATLNLAGQRHFVAAVVAQFFYVAAQVGVAAFFINFCTENGGAENKTAAYFLSIAMVLFTLGRFTGTALLKIITPRKLLTGYAFINVFLCAVVVTAPPPYSIIALMVVFFYESVMFPTVFALGIEGLGGKTKTASSILVMSIVGGAIVPYFMGMVADHYSTSTAYLIPMCCFGVVGWYGWKGARTAVG